MPPDTAAQFLGLRLGSPIIVGSSPLTLNAGTVQQLSIAGAGAIVLPSLFEEHVLQRGGRHAYQQRSPQGSFNPEQGMANIGIEEYLAAICELKCTTGIPVIASLCARPWASTGESWLAAVALELEEAGADGLEVTLDSGFPPASLAPHLVEQSMIELVSSLCAQGSIPVCVKLSPFHSHLADLAWRLMESGAAGIVCFAHDPQWEVRNDHIAATHNWSLTPAGNINPTIAGLQRIRSGGAPISLAASGGISSPEDLIKVVYAGADVAMVTSEIYRSGPDVVAHLYEGLCSYLHRHTLSSFEEFTKSRSRHQ